MDVTETQFKITAIPDTAEMLNTLEATAIAYTVMGDPSTTLSEVQSLLFEIDALISGNLNVTIQEVEGVTKDAKSALVHAREETNIKIESFEIEKRNRTLSYFFDYPRDIVFAFLTDDVNNALYIVRNETDKILMLCISRGFCVSIAWLLFFRSLSSLSCCLTANLELLSSFYYFKL